jgi:hypothetical protein
MASEVTSSIGTGKDYTTISAWESDKQGNLVTADQVQIGECYNETFAENVVIDGSTTDATRYMKLTVAAGERHSGTAGTGAEIDPSSSGHAVELKDDYTRLEWLEITGVSASSNEGVRIGADNCLLRNLIIHDLTPADSDGIYQGATAYDVTVENCLIYDVKRAGIHIQETSGSNNQTWNIRNCTFRNCGDTGEVRSGAVSVFSSGGTKTLNLYNNIAMDTPSTYDDFADTGGGGSKAWQGSNNITSDDTASLDELWAGLESRTSTDSSSPGAGDWVIFTSLTGGSEDFHLQNKTENDAIGAGTPLWQYFNDDADGQTRLEWSCGPFDLLVYRDWGVRFPKPPAGTLINPGHPSANGIIFAQPLNEGGGDLVLDASGRGNNGTISGADWIVGKRGTALDFVGASSDYVSFGDVLDLERTDPFTIEVSFQRRSATASGMLISKQESSGNYRGWYLYVHSPSYALGFVLRNTHPTDVLQVHTVAGYGGNLDPIHLVITYDGSSSASGVTIYVNGIAVSASTVSDTLSATTVNAAPLNLGIRNSSTTPFDGSIIESNIFNRVLAAEEIKARHYDCYAMYRHPVIVPVDEGVTVSPSPVSCVASSVNPSVVLGSVSITPTAVSCVTGVVAPTVVLGSWGALA